jgi:hypothetical protein
MEQHGVKVVGQLHFEKLQDWLGPINRRGVSGWHVV